MTNVERQRYRLRDQVHLLLHYLMEHRNTLEHVHLQEDWLMREILIMVTSKMNLRQSIDTRVHPRCNPQKFTDWPVPLWQLLEL